MIGTPFISLPIPFTPTASKNSRRVIQVKSKSGGKRMLFVPSKLATEHREQIRALMVEALMRAQCDLIPLRGRRVGFRLTWLSAQDRAVAEFYDLGELAKIPGPRRDISNMDAVILDAGNQVIYEDDSQVRHVELLTIE